MKQDTQLIMKEAMTGASKGALVAAASSIVGGVAMVSTPVTTLFGLITLGTTTAVALPVVVAVAVGGAVIGGSVAAIQRHQKNKKIDEDFENLHGKE
jgi:hypothetical protein